MKHIISGILISLLGTVALADSHSTVSPETATLRTAQDNLAEAWNNAPLTINNVNFVTGPADIVGGYAIRPVGPYPPVATMHIYAEPQGYGYRDTGDGQKEFGVVLDLDIETESGALLLTQNGFKTIEFKSQHEVHEMYLNLTVNISGLQAGNYKVKIRVHDLVSDEVGEFALPFDVE